MFRCLECNVDITDDYDRFNECVLNDNFNNNHQELGIGCIYCTSILYKSYQFIDKFGEFYSPSYSKAVKAMADAKNISKLNIKIKLNVKHVSLI